MANVGYLVLFDLAFVVVELKVSLSRVFLRIASCCSSFSAQMRRSLKTTSTPSMSPNTPDMMAWNTSWADDTPNGRHCISQKEY